MSVALAPRLRPSHPRLRKRSALHCSLGTALVGALLGFVGAAVASIDISLQMQLGNPSNASSDTNNHDHYLIQRTVEAIDYNDHLGVANWASWDLTWSDWNPSTGRTGSYTADTNLPPNFYAVSSSDYSNTQNYDRGHMCPSGDRTDNTTDNQLVFFLSNFIPQAADNNQGVWEVFETYCRSLSSSNELLITCGPSGFNGNWLPSGKVAIPQYVWKVVVVVPTNNSLGALDRINTSTRVIAIKTPNTNGLSRTIPWQTFVTSVNQIQTDTGYTFFTALPTNVANVLRAKVDGQAIPAPGITSFSPGGGAVNTTVVISGTNFDSASSVAFNGSSAAFTVDSSAQLTATVPSGASSGPISVTTPGGTATSAGSFTVTTVLAPDLALGMVHSGNFIQGDTADVYSLLVTNIGTAGSSGLVAVTNLLPAGLTATAMSGSGWTPNLVSLTCTRSDSLAAGATYPPITLTVTVSAGAAAALTNRAVLSGGGDTNPANNSISDLATVLPAGAPLPVTGLATAVGTTSATLNGTLNPSNQTARAWFEYGPTTSYGSTGAVSGTLSGTSAQAVSTSVGGLTPGATYHFRLGATNIIGAASALDQTFTLASSASSGITTIAGWDVSTLTNKDFGPSPFVPSTNDARVSIGGFTRGSGVGTNASGASRAWGGLGFTNISAAAAIASSRFVTFSATANAGYKISYSALSRFDYRHSSTGPTNGLVQYQIGSGGFTDLVTLAYSSSSSSGASLGPIDLTGVEALQNVGPGTPVTFRIVNWDGGSGGTWYIFDVANNAGTDFEVQGTVSPVVVAVPDLAVNLTHTGTFTQADTGDTCIITVTNLGTAATTGSVSVSDSLPAGLTASGMSGAGWTVDLGTLTCTRADALATGAGYPPITLTLNVATNASAILTNTVTVSGGGDATPGNNVASEVLGILPLPPIEAWRLQWFGTVVNSGSAADGAVQTSDGLPNLVKYALGLDPLTPATNPVVGDISTGYLRLSSPKNPNATDIIFWAEAADDAQGGWTTNGTIVDQNTATQFQAHDATLVNGAPTRFLRLRVSHP